MKKKILKSLPLTQMPLAQKANCTEMYKNDCKNSYKFAIS